MAQKPVEKVGILAFSFALRKDSEPNPCNRRLAGETMRAVRLLENQGKQAAVISQWEVALALPMPQISAICVIREHRNKCQYLDSDEVMEQAAEIFHREGVAKVIVIAQRFIHIMKCKMLVRKAGFAVYPFKVRSIGFDKKSDQIWTRSRTKLVIYTIRQIFFGYRGPAQT